MDLISACCDSNQGFFIGDPCYLKSEFWNIWKDMYQYDSGEIDCDGINFCVIKLETDIKEFLGSDNIRYFSESGFLGVFPLELIDNVKLENQLIETGFINGSILKGTLERGGSAYLQVYPNGRFNINLHMKTNAEELVFDKFNITIETGIIKDDRRSTQSSEQVYNKLETER